MYPGSRLTVMIPYVTNGFKFSLIGESYFGVKRVIQCNKSSQILKVNIVQVEWKDYFVFVGFFMFVELFV